MLCPDSLKLVLFQKHVVCKPFTEQQIQLQTNYLKKPVPHTLSGMVPVYCGCSHY